MRTAVVILACLGAGALSVAIADPPAAPAEPTSAPTADAPKSASVKDELTPLEKHFVSEGYHAEMRRGNKVFCRYEAAIGSRVDRQKICGSVEELKSAEEQAQAGAQQAARMQQNRPVN